MWQRRGVQELGVGKTFQEVRKKNGCSQLQFAMDNNIVRESVSAYETERARIPKDISKRAIRKFDSAKLAFEVSYQYTGAGVTWLDGDNVDLHRASVRLRVEKEITEALEAITGVCLANHPSSMQDFERRNLEHAIDQSIDGIYALSMYVARVCEDYGYSWSKKWDKHRQKLIARRYVKA